MRPIASLVLSLACGATVLAQGPARHFTDGIEVRAGRAHPILHYTLNVLESDTLGFDVRLHVRNAPDTFRIAMAKDPEYDDRFFRFVTNVRASGSVSAAVAREDSTVWRVTAPGGDVAIQYRVEVPREPLPRANHYPAPRGVHSCLRRADSPGARTPSCMWWVLIWRTSR